MAETSEKKYHVYDRKTGERANRTEYSSRSAASKAVDRLDNEYGGYRYYAKPVETTGASRSGGAGKGGSGIAGGGGMNPTDIEKVPGKRPLKFSIGGVVKKVKAKISPLKKSVVKPKATKPKKYQQGGVVTAQDVLKMAVGRLPKNMAYDFNGDGQITSADALVLAKKEAANKQQQSQMAVAQQEAQRQQMAAQQKASQTPNEMYRQPAPAKTISPREQVARLKAAQNATRAKKVSPAPTAPAPRIKLSQRLQAAQNATRAKMASPAPTAPMPTTRAEKKITNNEPALVRIRADEERRQQAANKPRGAYKGALITKKVAPKKVTAKKK